MDKSYKYLTSGKDVSGDDRAAVLQMIAKGRPVSLATFRRMCDTAEWEARMGYKKRRGPNRRLLRTDRHVRYYSSVFTGQPCYFAVHEGVEHIFVRPLPDMAFVV